MTQTQVSRPGASRSTNWWALGALAAAATVVGFLIVTSRGGGPRAPTRQDWIDLHGEAVAWRERGELAAAERAARAAMEIAPKVYGPSHFAVGESLNVLGLILSDQAEYEEALAVQEQAAVLIRDLLGPQSKQTAQAAMNLGQTLVKVNRFDEARPLLEKTVEVFESLSGPDHLDTAAALNNLAIMLDAAGDHAAALPLHERVLATRRGEVGPASPLTVESLGNLANSLVQSVVAADVLESQAAVKGGERLASSDREARLTRAQGSFEQVLAVQGRLLPPDSTILANSLSGAATVARLQGRLPDAARMALEALAVRQEKLGLDHPTTATSLDGLAKVRLAQGEDAEAEQLFTKAVDVRGTHLGPTHPKTMDSLRSLADFQLKRKKFVPAEKTLRALIEVQEKSGGVQADALIAALESLVVVLQATDRGKEAEEITVRIQKIRDAQAEAVDGEKKGVDGTVKNAVIEPESGVEARAALPK